MAEEDYDRKVFINCPYSSDHQELLRAMIFVIFRLGFIPCIASQQSDSGELRIDKIKRFIRECRHSIHDLSLVVAAKKGESARMNMPYELGLDLGARWYGAPPLDRKMTLVLEKQRGSVKKALSDHAGFDLRTHGGSVDSLFREIRAHFYAFFAEQPGGVPQNFPLHDEVWDQWVEFVPWVQCRPDGSLRSEQEIQSMEVAEFRDKVREWLAAQRESDSGMSPAYDLIRDHVTEVYDRFIQDAITPWAFFRTERGVAIDLPNGRKIRYSGLEFSGSCREIYWKLFPESFIHEITKTTFEWTRNLCDSRKLQPVLPLKETAMFLEGGLGRSLDRMAAIDRNLRGKGFPKSVPLYQPEREREVLEKIIRTRLKAELRLARA